MTPRTLTVVSYNGGFSIWSYTTRDIMPIVEEPGYFDPAYCLLNTGDIIVVAGPDGTYMRSVRLENKQVFLEPLR